MKIRSTGSKVHRVWKCPPSAVLPQIETIDEERPAADRGKAIHAFLERVAVIGRAAALAEAPRELQTLLECLDLDSLPIHLATEVAFLYDYRARTAREIGRSIGRDYAGHLERTGQAPQGPTELALTIDLAGVGAYGSAVAGGIGHRRGYAGDYKSGHTRYPPPDRFGQTLLAALCVLKAYDCADVVVELIYIRADGNHFTARRLVDEWDLEIFADELAAAMDLVDYAEAEYLANRGVPVREGPHCDHCPAFRQCPAKVALVRAIPAELASLGFTGPVIAGAARPALGTVAAGGLQRAKAAEIYMTVERIEEVLAIVKSEICNLAAHEPIDLPDGRVIGRLQTRREGLDGRIANAVIAQWFGAEAADRATDYKVSKEALREEVAAYVRRRKAELEATGEASTERLVIESKKGDGVFDRILAELRRRGGVEVTETDAIKAHVPKRKALK